MNPKNAEAVSEKSLKAETEPQKIWEKYDSEPLSLIMRNPQLTPMILLGLALAPVVIVVSILVMIFLVPEFSSQF